MLCEAKLRKPVESADVVFSHSISFISVEHTDFKRHLKLWIIHIFTDIEAYVDFKWERAEKQVGIKNISHVNILYYGFMTSTKEVMFLALSVIS